MKSRLFRFPCREQQIVLAASVLQTFSEFRQSDLMQPESGGLLFAEIRLPDVYIADATSPIPTDKCSRTCYIPDRKPQQKIIKDLFKQGLHLVGEWHTHPEPSPTPSSVDYLSMSQSFLLSTHELNSFIMIIVGNHESQLNLWVSAHTGNSTCRLLESCS